MVETDNTGMNMEDSKHREQPPIVGCRGELELKSLLLDSIIDAVIVHTTDGHLVYFNEAAAAQQGYSREEFAELGPWGWIAPEWQPRMAERMATIIRDGALPPFEARKVSKDGRVVCAEVHTRLVTVGGEDLCVGVVRDITDRVEAEEQVRHMAFHDALTGLANRLLFERRLEQAIEASDDAGSLGLLYIDLDDFKPINDRYGHAVGDRVLQVVARRICANVRAGDTVARLGGDEFGVLAMRLPDADAVHAIARQLGRAISERMSVEGIEVVVTASTGCAAWQRGETPRGLLKRADLDMYEEKLRQPVRPPH